MLDLFDFACGGINGLCAGFPACRTHVGLALIVAGREVDVKLILHALLEIEVIDVVAHDGKGDSLWILGLAVVVVDDVVATAPCLAVLRGAGGFGEDVGDCSVDGHSCRCRVDL